MFRRSGVTYIGLIRIGGFTDFLFTGILVSLLLFYSFTLRVFSRLVYSLVSTTYLKVSTSDFHLQPCPRAAPVEEVYGVGCGIESCRIRKLKGSTSSMKKEGAALSSGEDVPMYHVQRVRVEGNNINPLLSPLKQHVLILIVIVGDKKGGMDIYSRYI